MQIDLVVVDGPNLVNTVGSLLARDFPSGDVEKYLRTWFDVDRLLAATLTQSGIPALGIVIFHSRKGVGRSSFRVADPMPFWGRQGSNPNTSCSLVDLAGSQQDTYLFECEKCGERNDVRTTSEKGIDTAITTYLLETAERWESVCIVSEDVDFVPPVSSLRRRGKQVFCAVRDFSRDQAGSALVQACQSHFVLSEGGLVADFHMFQACQSGGAFDQVIRAARGKGFAQLKFWRLPPIGLSSLRQLCFRTGRDLPPGKYLSIDDARSITVECLKLLRADGSTWIASDSLAQTSVTFSGPADPLLTEGFERHAPVILPVPDWLGHLDGKD